MKTALYQNKPLSLATCAREKWHALYLASKRGEISCLHCGVTLAMQFAIHTEPSFIHPETSMACADEVAFYERKQRAQENNASITSEHFSLPHRRLVTDGTETIPTWRAPSAIMRIPNFTKRTQPHATMSHPYRDALKETGILIDEQQWAAIQHIDGPLCLLAGAGSGKTRVLTSRAAYMLTNARIPAKDMVLITFTAKAAAEMRARMRTYPGLDHKTLHTLVIRTFHSLFYKMLQHASPDRWQQAKLLQADWQRIALMKEVGSDLGLTDEEFAFDQALTQMSSWKNNLLAPKDVKPTNIFEERCRHLYERYEQARIAGQLFDFDDMLIGCLHLLQDNRSLLQRYQERFAYIAIDEFQDINKIQFDIIQLLAEPQRHLCVVGDDDQSIYAFRGSDPSYIRSFTSIYREAITIHLTENYRSAHPIIASANRVIANNRKRIEKTLTAQYTTDTHPYLFFPYNEEEEATMVIEEMKQALDNGAMPTDFAIIYRTNTAARAIIERLIDTNIPFTIEKDFDCFYARSMVRRALAFLRIGQDEENLTVLGDLMQALFIKRTRVVDLQRLQAEHQCSLLAALSFLDDLPSFQQKKLRTLPDDCRSLHTLTPTEALMKIEHKLGFKDTMKKQGKEGHKMDKGSDDFRQLQVIAAQFETITAFLTHIEQTTAKQLEKKRTATTHDGVHLLTIHRAKGLEFNRVYVIGTVDGGLPHDYALDALREGEEAPLEEERRLMYVAMTRAKTHLSISVPTYYRMKRAQPSRFIRTFIQRPH